jgi:hypothetical protein
LLLLDRHQRHDVAVEIPRGVEIRDPQGRLLQERALRLQVLDAALELRVRSAGVAHRQLRAAAHQVKLGEAILRRHQRDARQHFVGQLNDAVVLVPIERDLRCASRRSAPNLAR